MDKRKIICRQGGKIGMIGLIILEFYKMKHTSFNLIHFIVPILGVVVFLIYYSSSSIEAASKVNLYISALAIVFPLLIGIVCSFAIDIEAAAGEYKEIIGLKFSKSQCFFAKLIMLLTMCVIALGISVLGFAAGFKLILKQNTYPVSFYFMLICIMFASQIILYVFHMMLSFCFGKGVSMTVGVLESLVSALMLTNLGEVIWKFIPCAYGIRLGGYYMIYVDDPGYLLETMEEIKVGILIAVVLTILITVVAGVWFHRFEGKKCSNI